VNAARLATLVAGLREFPFRYLPNEPGFGAFDVFWLTALDGR
jgi:hypothetical protein